MTPGINEQPPPEDNNKSTRSNAMVDDSNMMNGSNARMLQPYTVFRDLDPQQQYKEIEKLEMQEEYDNSYNPLYTVPSVPDLMDAHHSALVELTQILHDTLPGKPGQQNKTNGTNVNVDPIPKIVRSKETILDKDHVPGAFPNGTTTTEESVARTTNENGAVVISNKESESYGHEAGRMLLEKSLRALVGVGKMLGFKGSEILSITEKIIKEETSS